VPELRIAIGHGQMPEHDLERTIRDFIAQRYNLLLCSTIIETGIDIPNANTILIYRADKLGLAQLHQLRGRVGRSYHQAYCYLITPEKITTDASKRIEAILATSELGAGFNLAMHDLEIRGAGEILGENQAGNIKEVGLSLYTEMLKKAINKLKHGQQVEIVPEDSYCEINLNASAILPDDYCNSVHERLIYYKRLAKATTPDEIDLIYQEIIDNYGLPTSEVSNLFALHQLRVTAQPLGIKRIDATKDAINLTFIAKPPLEPLQIVLTMQELKTCKFDGASKLSWQVKASSVEQKVSHIQTILAKLARKV
jgi:transcription-repair coupling factor (superfamily II helicase)